MTDRSVADLLSLVWVVADAVATRRSVGAVGVIVVSAVAILDAPVAAAARMLTVRKRGTSRFMNPGGKPEPGETPLQTAIREVHEELGLELDTADVDLLGQWSAAAANEVGMTVQSTVFRTVLRPGAAPTTRAEIDELRWLAIEELLEQTADAVPEDLAPLLALHVVPALIAYDIGTRGASA